MDKRYWTEDRLDAYRIPNLLLDEIQDARVAAFFSACLPAKKECILLRRFIHSVSRILHLRVAVLYEAEKVSLRKLYEFCLAL